MRMGRIWIYRSHLTNIKARLPELERLLEEVSSHWGCEDPVYRFYHQSFKVYALQNTTARIVDALRDLAPEGQQLCKEFEEIIKKQVVKSALDSC